VQVEDGVAEMVKSVLYVTIFAMASQHTPVKIANK
jgi:hypothetical protein